jgi:hypothetical protein
MIDPISAIGFSFACLNILLTGVSKLDERRRLISEYKERLVLYEGLLERCKIHLERWDDTWGNFLEKDYQLFFGESRDTIVKLQNNVAALAASIKSSIQGHEKEPTPTSENIGADESSNWTMNLKGVARNVSRSITRWYPKERDWKTWRAIIAKINANNVVNNVKQAVDTSQAELKKLEVMKRITFTLFQDQMLSENIDQLDKGIQALCENSQYIFNKRFERGADTVVEREVLENTKKEEAFVQLISGFANKLFEFQKQAREERGKPLGDRWNLEFRVPDGYGNVMRCDLLEVVRLEFAIQTRSPEKGWSLPRRLRLNYDTKQNPPAEASEIFRLAIGTLNVPDSETAPTEPRRRENNELEGILENLGLASRLSLPFRDIFLRGVLNNEDFAKGWRQEQAQLLRGLVNWILLLWHTNWTLNPCCCGIHFESLPKNGKRHVLISDITERQHDCRGCEDHLDVRMFSLGLTFAEIILETPLKLNPSRALPAGRQHVLQRWQAGRDGRGVWKGTSEGKLIQDIFDKAGEEVADAIKACLKFRVTAADNKPGFFNFFRKKILQP